MLNNPARPGILRLAVLLTIGILLSVGCSKEDVKKMAGDIKQKSMDVGQSVQDYASQAVEAVEDKLPETGSVLLKTTPEIEISSATVEVISIGDGRDNVVQISTYDVGSDPQSYPIMLLHGATKETSATTLVGKNVACDMYFRESYNAPIVMTRAGKSVDVNFMSYDVENKTVKISISSVSLIGSDNEPVSMNGGNVTALISGGN